MSSVNQWFNSIVKDEEMSKHLTENDLWRKLETPDYYNVLTEICT